MREVAFLNAPPYGGDDEMVFRLVLKPGVQVEQDRATRHARTGDDHMGVLCRPVQD